MNEILPVLSALSSFGSTWVRYWLIYLRYVTAEVFFFR